MSLADRAFLGAHQALATVAVQDLAVARRFYEGVLGLAATDTSEASVVGYSAGSSSLLVYESEFARTNQATSVTWPVGDAFVDVVRRLQEHEVEFEHYDFPGTSHAGPVHVMGAMRTVWFRDPDGNIHSVLNQ